MKLDVRAFGITCGLIWGIGLLAATWWIIAFEGQTGDATWIGQIYRGYTVSAGGSLVGMCWGLVDGFVGGIVFAWLYNRLAATG